MIIGKITVHQEAVIELEVRHNPNWGNWFSFIVILN